MHSCGRRRHLPLPRHRGQHALVWLRQLRLDELKSGQRLRRRGLRQHPQQGLLRARAQGRGAVVVEAPRRRLSGLFEHQFDYATRRRQYSSRGKSVDSREAALPGVVLRRGLVPRPDLVESRERLVVQRHLERADGRVELLDGAWTDDRPGDAVLGKEPGERHMGGLATDLVAEVLVGLDLVALGVELILGASLLTPLAFRLLAQHTAEEAAVQWAPRDDTEAVVLRCRQHLELDRALRQVVERLLADEAEEVALPRRLLCCSKVPPGEVAAADVQDLALRPQRFHRFPDLVPRSVPIDVMHLVEVDVVGLQPLERTVTRKADVARRQERVVGPVAHRAEQLRGDDSLLAATAALREPPADDLLGDAFALLPPVDVGAVEEVDAVLDGAVHDPVRVILARLRPEVHGAEDEAGDGQTGAAEVRVLHVCDVTPDLSRRTYHPGRDR